MQGPLVIDLPAGESDAILIRDSNQNIIGGMRKNAHGHLAFFGPNRYSNVLSINAQDKVHIGPNAPATSNLRLKVEDDVQFTGAIRLGIDEAFTGIPVDPRGCIQIGRTSATGQNQTMSLIRLFRRNESTGQVEECGRIGVDQNGFPCIMQGAQDVPLLTLRPSGAVWMYGDYNGQRIGVELTINNGSLKGQHGVSGKVTDIVPY